MLLIRVDYDIVLCVWALRLAFLVPHCSSWSGFSPLSHLVRSKAGVIYLLAVNPLHPYKIRRVRVLLSPVGEALLVVPPPFYEAVAQALPDEGVYLEVGSVGVVVAPLEDLHELLVS